ncbi:MAG: hypothetical protein D6695_09685 [Planctomycetota bacterium]|nr:MAG: hypothetical protein D6695_09685 [Planctomycetota bacterium]
MAADRDIFGKTPRRHANWDHRRGEPRTFALAWTIFLMLATLVMFSTLGAARVVTIDIYRPAVQALLLTITAGIVVLWPMTRLSQESPRTDICGSIARDLVVLLVPTQALIWPQTLRMLGAWPLSQTAALSVSQASWAIVIGGILALALIFDPRGRDIVRGAWMVVILLLVLGVPMLQVLLGAIGPAASTDHSAAAFMCSPLLAAFEILGDHDTPTIPTHWFAIGLTAFVGSILWATAWLVELARTKESA